MFIGLMTASVCLIIVGEQLILVPKEEVLLAEN
jgi:hypothetical protein